MSDQDSDSGKSRVSNEKKELLLQEYEMLFSQIFHWDNLLWKKYRIFLVIEVAFIAAVGQLVRTGVLNEGSVTKNLAIILILISIFNIVTSYIWFRTNRRNQEYLDPRFERILEIEQEVDDMLDAATKTRDTLSAKGSAEWEIYFPLCFLVFWSFAGGYSSLLISVYAAGLWFFVLLFAAMLSEWGMWFRIPRS